MGRVIEWVRERGRGELPFVCVFPGNAEHWFWSLRYSVEGEVGYALWGDKASGLEQIKDISDITGIPFKALVDRYVDALFERKEDDNSVSLLLRDAGSARPVIGVFYVKNVGIVGFGLVTDITLDAFRNFKYWREDQGHWVIRWRMRVLWLHPGVRDLLRNPGFTWKDEKELIDKLKSRITEDKSIKSEINEYIKSIESIVPKQGNMCLSDESKLLEVWLKINAILSDNDEVNSMVEFYGYAQSSVLSMFETVSISELNIDLIVKKISEELYFDEAFIRRFVNAVRFGNVLLVGPPGVGKTSLAVRVAKELGGDGGYMIRVANALWFRRDVIGGETLEEGSVKWRAGMLIQAYNRVVERLINGDNRPFFVIIDELNRADVDKAFGEFFAIFRSPNPSDWELPIDLVSEIEGHGERIDEEAKHFLENFKLAKDKYDDPSYPLRYIRIIGTMNVVDIRNLFIVGEAALRRFILMNIKCPEGDSDVRKFLDKTNHLKLSEESKKLIADFVREIRGQLRDKPPCVSPGAVKLAVELLDNAVGQGLLDVNDKKSMLEYFVSYLESSLGIVVGEPVKRFRRVVDEVTKRLISVSEK